MTIVTGFKRGNWVEVGWYLAQMGCQSVLTACDSEKGQVAAVRLCTEDLTQSFSLVGITNKESINYLLRFTKGE